MRKSTRWIQLPLLVFYLIAAFAVLTQAAPRQVTTVEGITEYRLDNAMRVLLFPDASKPTVTVHITYLVGSRHEGYGEAGMAHLLEHMLFKGTPTHQDIPGVLRGRGAQMNGTTSFDRTNYFETLPAEGDNLEFALRLEADRMINSYVRKEDLDSEMTVVRSEFEMGENNPLSILYQRIFSVAFDWHNYGKSTIGNRADIERVPIDKLKAFYRRYYQPDNAVLVVAGRFDPDQALTLIEKYFGSIPKPVRDLDQTYTEEPAADGERTVALRRVGEVGAVGVAYRVPAGPHADFPAIDVMTDILTNEPSGRLYKALVETRKATSIYGGASSLHDPGLLLFLASVRRDGSLEEVKDILIDQLEGLATKGVTDEEVARAREKYLRKIEMAMTDTTEIASFLSEATAMGDWRMLFLDRDRMEKVTPESVRDVAARYLVQNNRILGLFVPTDEPQRVTVPARPDVAALIENYQGREQVAAGEEFDPTPENVEARTQRHTLPSGLKVAMLPKKTRGEVVELFVRLRYGTADNLKGMETAAALLPTLMTKGTDHLTQQEIEDLLDTHRATISGAGSTGAAIFTVQTKRSKLPAVLELLRQILREPSLPENEWEILRGQWLEMYERASKQPDALAPRRVKQAISPYPPGDVRYVPTFDESIERLKTVEIDQVRRLYHEYLGGAVGEAAIVGDFDPAEVLPMLSGMLNDWTAKMPQEHIQRRAGTDMPAVHQTIDTPDMANAAYQAGLAISMDALDPDFPAMVIGNHILGASAIDSRLGDRIRKQEGLSYSVGSQFSADMLDTAASFTIRAICNPQNMTKLKGIVDEELERLLRDGVTDEELADAKKKKLHEWHMQWIDDSQLAAMLAGAMEASQTMLYRTEHRKAVEALTTEQVLQTLRKYLDLQRLVVITAGDFQAEPVEEPAAAAVGAG